MGTVHLRCNLLNRISCQSHFSCFFYFLFFLFYCQLQILLERYAYSEISGTSILI